MQHSGLIHHPIPQGQYNFSWEHQDVCRTYKGCRILSCRVYTIHNSIIQTMVSKFTLLGLLLATVALAVPSSLVEAPIARGHEDRQSQPISHVASRDPNPRIHHTVRAGAILKKNTVRIIPMP